MSTTISPGYVQGDSAAAAYCGFKSRDKFREFCREHRGTIRIRQSRSGMRRAFKISELDQAMDATINPDPNF